MIVGVVVLGRWWFGWLGGAGDAHGSTIRSKDCSGRVGQTKCSGQSVGRLVGGPLQLGILFFVDEGLIEGL